MPTFRNAALALCLTISCLPALAQDSTSEAYKRSYDENFTDQEKLALLRRKAAWERSRAASFAGQRLPYKPAKESLEVNLPSSAEKGLVRLEQLNRINVRLDRETVYWLEYEFGAVQDHIDWLNKQSQR